MKILITSDWHADKSTAGVDRFDDVAQAAKQAVSMAIAEGVDLFAFLGDLTDPDDGPRALRAVQLAIDCSIMLTRANVSQVWLAGNHDVIEDASGRTTLTPLRALSSDNYWPWIAETGESRVLGDGDGEVHIVVLPYPAVSKSYDMGPRVKELVEVESQFRGIVLAHSTYIPGVVEGEETLEMPRGRVVELPVDVIPKDWTVVNGHWHTPQVTPGGVLVPGALARLTRGEAGDDPRFLIVEI